jgi:hypothetical protein
VDFARSDEFSEGRGSETSGLPHCLHNLVTDDGEVVSLARRPLFTSRKIPGTRFC